MEDINRDKECTLCSKDPPVPGPVYFLIREQAKSVVAIKDLEHRFKFLENIQEDIVHALRDLNDQIKQSSLPFKKFEETQDISSSSKKKQMVSESSDKQDSGLDSDQGQMGGSPEGYPHVQDELLNLLEVIGEKGLFLQRQVADLEKMVEDTKNEKSSKSSVENDRLIAENKHLQQTLKEMDAEKRMLKMKLREMEIMTHHLKQDMTKLQDNLECTLSEKHQLESRIHKLHVQSLKGATSSRCVSPMRSGPEVDKVKEKNNRWSNDIENHLKVSAILRETNLLELQRQLLIKLMDNEVLQAKCSQAEQTLNFRSTEWMKTEVALHGQLKKLNKDKEELSIQLEESKLEYTAVQAKAKMLERILLSVTQDSNFADSELSRTKLKDAMFKEAVSLPVNLPINQSALAIDSSNPPVYTLVENKIDGCDEKSNAHPLYSPPNYSNSFYKHDKRPSDKQMLNHATSSNNRQSSTECSLVLDSELKDSRKQEDRQQRQRWLRQAFQALLSSPVQSREAAKIIHQASDKNSGDLQQQLQTILGRFSTSAEGAVV